MANEFTVADVLEWARTKPADERYDYNDHRGCALCQFLIETNRAVRPTVAPWDVAGEGFWDENFGPVQNVYARELEPALSADGDETGWTFGALVKRLEAIVQEAPVVPSPWTDPQTYLDADCGEYVA